MQLRVKILRGAAWPGIRKRRWGTSEHYEGGTGGDREMAGGL
jgi:hypothetical protein